MTAETLTQIKDIFGSNTKILSCKTIRKRLNEITRSETILTSKQVNKLLQKNKELFTRVSPTEVGSSKWFDAKFFDKTNLSKSNRLPRVCSLWKLIK